MIAEMRALRRLMVRHPPTNNQRSTAFFLSLGYYDVFVRKLHRAYHQRWTAMGEALQQYFPDTLSVRGMGGSSYWVTLNDTERVDTDMLAQRALKQGIFIEAGSVYFNENTDKSSFRLGYSSIEVDQINSGLQKLSNISQSF